jgi:glycosyltransferase involved in cell wall biosynthesis
VRVAFTTDYYPPHVGGGVEVVVSELASRLAAAGHEVLVVTLGRDDWPLTEVQHGVLIHRFPSTRLNRLTGLEITVSIRAQREMRQVLEGFAPDVVNAHHLYFTTTPPALKAARDLGIPTVLTLHVAGMEAFGGWRGSAARLYERVVAQRLIGRSDAVMAVSEAVAESARAFATGPVTVIPNGVDMEVFQPRALRDDRELRLVFVGRLIANKGPDVALDAFLRVEKLFPEARLTMVGDGPMRSRLEHVVNQKGTAGKVEFLGTRTDVAEILGDSDLFVRPSLVEGMPLTVLEAMATALPVIVCDVGGVSEIVSNDVTGFVVPPGSSGAVAEAMALLLGDEERRQRMGAAGLVRVREGYSWDAAAAATERLLGQTRLATRG